MNEEQDTMQPSYTFCTGLGGIYRGYAVFAHPSVWRLIYSAGRSKVEREHIDLLII